MEITKALHTDHVELKSLLETITTSEKASEIHKAFDTFAELLKKHAKAEEKVVYDALLAQKDEEIETDAREGYNEHQLADTMLKKLKSGADPLSPEWQAEAKVMKELLEHHIKEEEDDIFADVRDSFELAERKEMGEAFEELKGTIPA
jgi:hemerythrin superfamily protein